MPNVQWKTPDDGQTNCPNHIEFLDKNKFGKISASIGFIKKKISYNTSFSLYTNYELDALIIIYS